MSQPIKPWHEIFETITNNKRFVPFDEDVARSPLTLGEPDVDGKDEQGGTPLSHDRPLPGALSGVIEMDWLARTPVLFGQQVNMEEEDLENGHPRAYRLTIPQRLHAGENAPFVIPGRAIRGMIRQILRIASKGKAGPIDDVQPTRRDTEYQTERMDGNIGDAIQTGWLVIEDGKWMLKKCESRKVSHQELQQQGFNVFDIDQRAKRSLLGWHKYFSSKSVAFDDGHLVMSAAMPGKKHENIFCAPIECVTGFDQGRDLSALLEAYGKEQKGKRVPDSNLAVWVAEHLSQVADEPKKVGLICKTFNVSASLKGVKLRPDNPPGIPVYYSKDAERLIIGMTQVMRFPTERTVKSAVEAAQPPTDCLDWAEAMLGYVDGQDGLRGRIDFGFATSEFCEGCFWPPKKKDGRARFLSVVQMAPRPGYAPFYLRRKDLKGDPATYDSDNGIAAGRARYPVWTDAQWEKIATDRVRSDLPFQVLSMPMERMQVSDQEPPKDPKSYLRFVKAGTEFHGKMHFHNLLPEELGALLWTLSLGQEAAFDGSQKQARFAHSGGRARSLSFGSLVPQKIKLRSVQKVTGTGTDDDPFTEGRDKDANGWSFAKPLMESFASKVRDANSLEAFHQERHVARLLHLCRIDREDGSPLHLGRRGRGEPFKDYIALRSALEGRAKSWQFFLPMSLKVFNQKSEREKSRLKEEALKRANLVRQGAQALVERDDGAFSGNIMDHGSDPEPESKRLAEDE